MSFDDKDSFWDVSKLVPPKKKVIPSFSTREKLVEVSVPGDNEKVDASENRITDFGVLRDGDKNTEEKTYTFGDGFIKSVTVRHTPDKYDYYANFVKAAKLYFDFKTPGCDFVPFYSYMPQYIQLSQPQKNYYFYWRSMVRRKKYVKTDYSYFYLYVYEVVNLPDLIAPEAGLEILIDLWCAYRKALPNIDANMSLWIQDYCLLYALKCPVEKIRDFVFSTTGKFGFKEFYLSDVNVFDDEGVLAVVSYLSEYNWREGKYAGGDTKEIYAKHLSCAMRLVVSRVLDLDKILSDDSKNATLERFAFKSMLTTSAVKYRLKIVYKPILDNLELKGIVTAALRYTENKLRALMGVKSRLSVKDLPAEYKESIDLYFAKLFDEVNRKRALEMRPEYEKLYEADNIGICAEFADEIESDSWETTARLVEDFDVDENDISAPKIEDDHRASEPCDTYGLGAAHIGFIKAALESDATKMHQIATEAGEMPDTMADIINEAFSDNMGDVILEPCEELYTVIDDYKEEIVEWLSKLTK